MSKPELKIRKKERKVRRGLKDKKLKRRSWVEREKESLKIFNIFVDIAIVNISCLLLYVSDAIEIR